MVIADRVIMRPVSEISEHGDELRFGVVSKCLSRKVARDLSVSPKYELKEPAWSGKAEIIT